MLACPLQANLSCFFFFVVNSCHGRDLTHSCFIPFEETSGSVGLVKNYCSCGLRYRYLLIQLQGHLFLFCLLENWVIMLEKDCNTQWREGSVYVSGTTLTCLFQFRDGCENVSYSGKLLLDEDS